MRHPFQYLLAALLFLGMAQVVWADDFEGDGLYSRQLVFETLHSSLDIDRDPEFTPEEIDEFETLFHDFATNPDLTDDEVFALNRSLNNARRNPWRIDFTTEDNWALLENLIENDYDSRQITSLTKALESEAKFLSHYDRTGKEFFLNKAEAEKNKFLSRAGELGELDDDSDLTPLPEDADRAAVLQARLEARSALKDAGRLARLQAKSMAKETTRSNSKNLSRNSAKQLVQEVQRELKRSSRGPKGNKGKNK